MQLITNAPPPAYDAPSGSAPTDEDTVNVRLVSTPGGEPNTFQGLVSIMPPFQPAPKQNRAAVDIICVVDVSYSTNEPATLPAEPCSRPRSRTTNWTLATARSGRHSVPIRATDISDIAHGLRLCGQPLGWLISTWLAHNCVVTAQMSAFWAAVDIKGPASVQAWSSWARLAGYAAAVLRVPVDGMQRSQGPAMAAFMRVATLRIIIVVLVRGWERRPRHRQKRLVALGAKIQDHIKTLVDVRI
ncbi:hypothetical protein BKA62DRAFT_815080 [Auriculariales sp. MPI-PUGE-AT-0066]|nr:hypothetical protein BKA62DRAFT_815080 [Auriculariales sp. MPI-PUGE-AT-0066]